jgi:hypothetical protein
LLQRKDVEYEDEFEYEDDQKARISCLLGEASV